jgi:hypothetical protein
VTSTSSKSARSLFVRPLLLTLAVAALGCPSSTSAQAAIPSPRPASLQEASLLLVQGVAHRIRKDSLGELLSTLYDVLNSGDCYPAKEACSNDWYLALGVGVAGAPAKLWFLGQFSLVEASWAETGTQGTSGHLRVTYQLPAKNLLPGTPGPVSLRHTVTYSVGIDSLYRLPSP